MQHKSKLVLATVLAGSIGLAGLGVARAQSTADTPVISSATPVVTADDSGSSSVPLPPRAEHLQHRLEDQAADLGISADDLKAELASGKPFYQIAAEHGVTYDDLKAKQLEQRKTRLDDMVKVGFLTQAQADAAYQQAQSTIFIGGFGPGPHGHSPMK